MKRWLVRFAGLLAALAIAGVLVVVSGVVPVAASSGHWAITERFLTFSMRRSIAAHSLGIEVPPLDDPDLVLRGALHYEIGCRSCHGSPGAQPPRIPHAMAPPPADLNKRIPERRARELFYVVKHGVKFTGMPAWPAKERDDEVWAVVAFLRRLPELDEVAYQRLIHGEPLPEAPSESLVSLEGIAESAARTCAPCHGADGIGRGSGAFPHLAGQRSEYLVNALEAYASGERHSGTMGAIAAGLTAESSRALAGHYSGLAPRRPTLASDRDTAATERGRAIAHDGIPVQRVPACIACHAQEGDRHQPAYPLLAGQPAEYLALQLELFRAGHRGGSAFADLMQAVAPRLTPEQARDVALYFESLPPR